MSNARDSAMGIIRNEQNYEGGLCNKGKLGEDLFQLTDETFKDSNIDLRAISALMVAGIYYLVLHANSNNSLFCEIDIKDSAGFSRINNALAWVISQAYDEAAKQKADVI